MKTIDCYGFTKGTLAFQNSSPDPVDICHSGTTTYLRYTLENPCAIWSISESDGTISIRWAYGNWNNKSSLTYNTTTNETLEV